MLLDKKAILASQDLKFEIVEVPEWGGSVRVSEMTGFMRDQFEFAMADARKKDAKNIRALFVAFAVVDEDNNLVFTKDDIDALGKKSSKALSRVFDAAENLNKVWESVETGAKNS